MDFFKIGIRETKGGTLEVYPDFQITRSKDLMVRARSFYAIWDDERQLWSRDEYDVRRLVDEALKKYVEENSGDAGEKYNVKYLLSFNSQGWTTFRKFIQNISDSYHQLDNNLVFANQDVKKTDYASKRLPYPLAPGDHSAWDEIVGTLYSIEERTKLEWAIGAVVSGDSKKIQKFLVLYGLAGTGKSTILNIIQKLFEGYTATFEAKALGMNSNAFATEAFSSNPLVAIQHDGDLSKIEDNTKLNSIIAHEEMTMNEKYKPSYTSRVNAILFMGTNQPVKISDAKSGIIRRLIDVHPTGVTIPANRYHMLMSQIDFELGAIASHCLEVYRTLGKNYYNAYRPTEMMLQTDIFFNFIEAHFDVFKMQDGTTLKQAYTLYKEFCTDTGIERPLPQYKFREELRNYFDIFHDRFTINGQEMRSYYSGFTANKFKATVKDVKTFSLVMEETVSLLDELLADMPAQEASAKDIPKQSWSSVKTRLADLDTTKTHFVKVPEHHIVIDFDLKDENGEKSLERNLEAASVWLPTYGELSKSGSGVHLHYIFDGDSSQLSSVYSEGIEVKVYAGDSSLRRRLSKCNAVPVATINSGLPMKEKKKVLTEQKIQSERALRDLIKRNLRREIHPGTKPSVDFIKKILDDAFDSGLSYDVTDMRSTIMAFANGSSNQPFEALKVVQKMKWKGQDVPDKPLEEPESHDEMARIKKEVTQDDDRNVFFDVEVYPNLFVICWKYEGSDTTVRMINPKAQDVERLFKLRLIGFYNRRYDNHILYAAYMGYNLQQLFELSQRLIDNKAGAAFGEAYNLSYADIWDFSSKKQSLKKFEIELGVHHLEMDIPWDKPVPEEDWERVVEYCVNDVEATEVVFADREQDFVARQILATLSGLTVNDPTPKHTAKIVFGNDREAQRQFVYTDLSKEFPGYVYDFGKSTYLNPSWPADTKPEDPGEGGYVYAEPGVYEDVALLDIASMHPTTIGVLNMFGDYTKNFTELKDARIAIKNGEFDKARQMLGGRLEPYLRNEFAAKDLAYALKIVINIVYGLTSAKFDNPFRDVRNKDNIVAKRGALFMIDLKRAVQEKGYTVVHIKTDSIKIAAADKAIIDFVFEYGTKFGYDFEHEATYDKLALVNDAVYVAHKAGAAPREGWTAVGAQFQHPFVFKTLFTHEEIKFDDYCETKQVSKGHMYLDFGGEIEIEKMAFVGRTGRFVPVTEQSGVGGTLYRVAEIDGERKKYAVSGTKGYRWIEAENADALGERLEVDMAYFEMLVNDALNTIDKWGPVDPFVGG